MANEWFKFKMFTVKQDRCAMKVGTDAVLLGAWTDLRDVKNVLDIGTGTGLLALMLAQRSNTIFIDALEIDAEAALQAGQNAIESPFKARISVLNQDFRTFWGQCAKKYDLLISNPPYFKESMKPETKSRTLARHEETLTLEQIFMSTSRLLADRGRLSLILPADRISLAQDKAKSHHLFLSRILHVIPVPGKEVSRACMEFSFHRSALKEDSLIVEDGGRHQYSDAYKKLTRDFYLEM